MNRLTRSVCHLVIACVFLTLASTGIAASAPNVWSCSHAQLTAAQPLRIGHWHVAADQDVELEGAGSADAVVVVDGPEPVRIEGRVSCKGQLLIISRAGFVIAPTARIEADKISLLSWENAQDREWIEQHCCAGALDGVGMSESSTPMVSIAGQLQAREILVQAGAGSSVVTGRLDASSSSGRGGEIRVFGHKVAIDRTAVVSANGTTEGGAILIGGDYQGVNPTVNNAAQTVIAAGASLTADARDSGHGGRVIVWADKTTRFQGAISARGGPSAGDGGFAEVSGKGVVDFRGTVDLIGANGRNGSLLLDPQNITVQNNTPDANGDGTIGDDVTGNIAASSFSAMTSVITSGQVAALLGSANLSLAATNNINMNDAVNWNSAFGLTLVAGNQINLNASITNGGTGTQTYNGAVILGNSVTLTGGSVSFGSTVDGAWALTVNAGSGNIIVTGTMGGQSALGAVVLNSAGTTTLHNVTAASLALDAPGINQLLGTIITTTPTVQNVLVFKGTSWWQNSAGAPFLDPSPPGANYATPPNNGGPYNFKVEVGGTNLSGITAPTVTLPAGSTYPTQNPVRHNGGVLGYNANEQSWGYGVDANNYSAPTAAERDASLAFGTYGLNVMGTSFNLNFPATSFPGNTPSVTLSGGTWVRGRYLIDVTQPLTITTNAFANYDKNADGAMQLSVDGVFNQLTFYSDNHSANNFLTYTIPANTLVAGTNYTAEAVFFAIMDKSTALAGSINVAAYVENTNFRITAYSGALPSATLYGIDDLAGGASSSEVRDATRVNDVLFAVGAASANPGSTGRDTGVIWTTTGGLRALPNLQTNTTATTFITASAITPDASYIASRARNVSSGGSRNAVRVAANGLTNLNFGTLAGFNQFSAAVAISSDGSVLYGFGVNGSGQTQAVRYTASGPTVLAIPFLNAGDNSSTPAGRGCSADGSVMVGTSTNTGTGHTGAFRYVQGSGVTAIPYLAGGTSNTALAVSPDGNLTLVSGNSSSAPSGEFYLYNATTATVTPLGTPNGNRGTFGSGGMTSDGSVVAVSINGSNGSASYIHNSHGWHNLQTVVAGTGVDLTGWTLDPVAGMSADGTLAWGMGTHNGNTEGFVVDFAAGYLAAFSEPSTFSSPNQAIVGAWTFGDTTANGAAVLVFFGNGYYLHLQTATPADAPNGVTGFERGQYTWNAATGALVTHTLLDTNGDIGLSGNDGGPGITVTISGNTMTANGGASVGTRVAGPSPIVGAYGAANIADGSAALVFLPNGYYYMAQDGDSTPAGDPNGHDGMEWGTYSWNSATGAFTATTLVDTNGQWGLSNPQGAQTVALSGDRLTLTFSSGSGSHPVPRAGAPLATSTAADFNGDGQSDLLWQNAATGERAVWLMNGSVFASGLTIGVIPSDWSIAATADFNADGKPDLVWQNTVTGERAIWLMNGGTFVAGLSLGVVPTDWSIAATADFNGDGKPDLLWQNTVTGERSIWLMNGGTFMSGVSLGVTSTDWVFVAAADFNADGKPDILLQNLVTGEGSVWLMNGSSVSSSVSLSTVPTPLEFAGAGDYNGDGKPDILWTNPLTGEHGVWLMNGTTFSSSVSIATLPVDWVLDHPVPHHAAVNVSADFNGDNKSDIVWQNTSTGEGAIWLMNGGTFLSGISLGVLPTAWSIAGTGDFNGDAQADLVWRNTATGEDAIWLMNAGTFQSGISLGVVPTDWSIAGIADFNADGKPDLLWQNAVTGERAIWLMNGGVFMSGITVGIIPTDWSIAGTGDFNGDGKPDLVWQNTTTGERAIWLMNGGTFLSGITIGVIPTDWSIAGTGDFNADGKPDLIWQNTATGERSIWLMNGGTFVSGISLGVIPTAWSIRN